MPDRGEETLGDLLMRSARTMRRRWSTLLEPWELSPHQSRALRTIGAADGQRLSDVADRLRIAPRSATEVVDSLQARGLVERRADPADRRAVLVRLTETGRRIADDIERARDADTETFLARLGSADRRQLERILRRLLDA